jgi:hypothetical protein
MQAILCPGTHLQRLLQLPGECVCLPGGLCQVRLKAYHPGFQQPGLQYNNAQQCREASKLSCKAWGWVGRMQILCNAASR